MQAIENKPVRPMFGLYAASALLLLAGCQSGPMSGGYAAAPSDGDIAVPADYRSWSRFVPTVDKAKAGQVREIYINDVGLQADRGDAFPPGTVSVMEIYKAQRDKAGSLVRDGRGRLVKDDLASIFVMQKGSDWGRRQPGGVIDNGDWVYGAFKADGMTMATNDFGKCRECHQPLAGDDYVARYAEHFDYRMK